jgi:hypothetical protein
MFALVTAKGVRETFTLLGDIADRARDASPAYDEIADDVFARQRRFWLTNGDGSWEGPSDATLERDRRDDRDPRMMRVTGGLEEHSTRRGAQRQLVHVAPTYLLVDITSGLAVIHEARGHKVMPDPTEREADRYAGRVARYILTGET